MPPPSVYPSSIFFRLYLSLGSIHPLPLSSPGSLLSSPGSLLSSASFPDLLRSSPLSFPSYCIKNPLFLNNNTADSLLSDILKESIFLCLKKSIAMSWLANTSITSAIAAPSLKSPSPPQAICLPLTIVKTTAHLPLPPHGLPFFRSPAPTYSLSDNICYVLRIPR